MRRQLYRATLAGQVADSLRDSIEGREFAPGESLPSEMKLATEFGVSRPVIREALRSLEAQGIIAIANGKGALVRPVSSDQLRSFFRRAMRMRPEAAVELLEVRKGVEMQSAALAAQRRTTEDVRAMRHIVATMEHQLHAPHTYTDLDAELHVLIAAATRNEMMRHLVESLREPMKDTIRVGLHRRINDDQRVRVQEIHELLVSAIQRGDAQEAVQVMAQHFDEAVTAIVTGDDWSAVPAIDQKGGQS